ncbi:spore germination protein [Thermaerobacter subterraneus]|uniref:GerA spore germination protein n=1 Tax=Thermaerobacter subterraneus DSM 13965 TaxID=867903 RepID=K6Q3F8_9FIRM|nr:spore germination protein [Thermaerobacter subterraneus]EKP95818.1 GerA spore germination protein [Thermaerobacter subterraneus DSM 13965]
MGRGRSLVNRQHPGGGVETGRRVGLRGHGAEAAPRTRGMTEIRYDGPAGWWAVANLVEPSRPVGGKRRDVPATQIDPTSRRALKLLRRHTRRTLAAIDTLLDHVREVPGGYRRLSGPARRDLERARRQLAYHIGPSDDIVYRPFHFGLLRGLVVYAEGVVDPQFVSQAVLEPLQRLAAARWAAVVARAAQPGGAAGNPSVAPAAPAGAEDSGPPVRDIGLARGDGPSSRRGGPGRSQGPGREGGPASRRGPARDGQKKGQAAGQRQPALPPELAGRLTRELQQAITIATQVRRTRSYRQAAQAVVEGKAVLVVAGVPDMLTFGAEGWPKRQPDEPESERTIRGPREGLVETLSDNLALIRRFIRDPSLRVRKIKLGKVTRTPVAMVYIENLAPQATVDEVWERLQSIDADAIIESGTVEEYLTGRKGSIFPLVHATERTDKVAAALLEGRVVVLVDRSPFALFVPTSLAELYQSPDDYYVNFWQGTAVRLLRIVGLFISLALPGLYITLVGFHPELIPTKLALASAGIRQGTPMPAAVELVAMELLFELFREGGLRLPAAVGQTVGIAGGVVLGTAAAQAGFVSGIVIVVTAGTAIASFAIPNYFLGLTWRILKFALIALSATFGLTGLVAGMLLVAAHLAAAESAGAPYMTPFGPMRPKRLLRMAVRPPHWEKGAAARP